MRILVPTHGLDPGAVGSEDHNHAIIALLARRGHTLTVAGPGQQPIPGIDGDIEWLPLPKEGPPPRVFWRASDALRVYRIWRMYGALGVPRWDVMLSGLLPALCASRLRWPRVPRVYVPHSVIAALELKTYEMTRTHALIGMATYHLLQRWAWRHADVAISSSAMAADLRSRHYGGAPRQLVVSPFGVDTSRFRPDARDPALLAALEIPIDAPVVVSVGRLIPSKDFAFLLRSFARLTTPRARLLIVGDGVKREELQRMADGLGVADRVRFAGFRRDVERYFALGHAYALSSRLESFGLTLVQAMACGLPSVARHPHYPDILTASPELIDEGRTGFLAHTEAEFAARLDELLSRPDRARAIGVRARREAITRFSWEGHADDVERALRLAVERCGTHQSISASLLQRPGL